jgi:hypothetical protein
VSKDINRTAVRLFRSDAESASRCDAERMDAEFDQKRHDQLTTAPQATEEDAAPRIRVSETADGTKRIDWRDDADVSPGSDAQADEVD